MEIIDKPLSEIIKEQNIGQALRRKRRGAKGGQQQRQKGERAAAPAKGSRGGFKSSRTGGRDRFGNPFRRFRPSYSRLLETRRNAVDYGDVRRHRSVKSTEHLRDRRLSGYERNERSRDQRRRETISRARSRSSRD